MNHQGRLFLRACVCSLWFAFFPSLPGFAQPAWIDFPPRIITATEGSDSALIVPVWRHGNTNLAFTVDYATSNRTAIAGADYIARTGTLAFSPGETNKEVVIPLIDDGVLEYPAEEFVLTLRNPSTGAAFGGFVEALGALLRIEDNEEPSFYDGSFNPGTGPDGDVFSIAIQPDGKALLGGSFGSFNSTNRGRMARMNFDGSLDLSFDPGLGANGIVYAVALQTNGQVLIGGAFTSLAGVAQRYLARLNANGSLDESFAPSVDNELRAILVQPDGQILIAGRFRNVASQSRSRIARLNADGSLDTMFDPGSGASDHIRALALQPDGKVILAGQFASVNGVARLSVARLDADGSLDTAFTPTGCNGEARAAALQTDGRVLIGGDFTAIGGASRNRIARLNTDGSLDTSFEPAVGASDTVRVLTVQPDGRILVGGRFTYYDTQNRFHLARVNPDGWVDFSFPARDLTPWAGVMHDEVFAIVPQGSNTFLLGGQFFGTNRFSHSFVERIYADTSFPSFELSSMSYGSLEDAGPIKLTIRRNGNTSAAASVDCATLPGTASAGLDFMATNGTVQFAPLETTKEFFMHLVNDDLVEPNEFFFIRLLNPSPGSGLSLPGGNRIGVTIFDNDSYFEFALPNQEVKEGTNAIITVRRRPDAFRAATVDFFIGNGTATPGVDYAATNGTLLFAVGEYEKTFTVRTLADAVTEGSEMLLLHLTNATGGTALGPVRLATLNIIDAGGVFDLDPFNLIVREEAPSYTISVSRSGSTVGTVTIEYSTFNLSAQAGQDYVATSGTLTFPDGEFYKTLSIPILDDTLADPGESFGIYLHNPSLGTSIGFSRTNIVTILDDEDWFAFWATAVGTGEQFSTPLLIYRYGNATGTSTVDFTTVNGSAQAGLDYVASSGTLTFEPGQREKQIKIEILNDSRAEPLEIFSITLSNPSPGSTLGSPSTLPITIEDNDTGVEFALTNSFTSENAANVVLRVQRGGDGNEALAVNYYTVAGTAVAGVDYATRSALLTIPPGADHAIIAVPIIQNASPNPTKTFEVIIENPAPGTTLGQGTLTTVYILDDDVPGKVDATFDARLTSYSAEVRHLALWPDGGIAAALYGSFRIDGVYHPSIVRFHTDGSLDTNFSADLGPHNGIESIVIQSDGKLLYGSRSFVPDGNLGSRSVHRLKPNGDCDNTFSDGCNDFGAFVYWLGDGLALALEPNDDILLGGSVYSPDQSTYQPVARYRQDGTWDTNFIVNYSFPGNVIALQQDGKILLSGKLSGGYDPILGNTWTSVVERLHTDGRKDLGFNPTVGRVTTTPVRSEINAILVQPDQRILIAGQFDSVSGVPRSCIARLQPDGSVDASFNPGTGADWPVNALARQENGKILVGGSFTTMNGVTRRGIARLNTNGSLDTTFDPGTGAGGVNAIVLQPDGGILVGGGFDTFDGVPRPGLVRLQGDFVLRITEAKRAANVTQLTTTAQRGRRIELQASSNLVDWISIRTNIADGPLLHILDTNAPASRRFYRAF